MVSLALLSFKGIKHYDLQLCQQQSSLFSKTFPKFPQNCLLLLEYLHFKLKNFSKRLIITILILSANCYLNKTRLTSSKNIYQIIDLIEFINANLEKIIIYNLPEYFTVFRSILLKIVYCVFDKFFEYVTLLFCLLIVQRSLIISFIFDAD